MNKLFTVSFTALTLGLGLSGCLLGPASDEDEVSIDVDQVQIIGSSGNISITGDIKANVEINSVTCKVLDAVNAEVSPSLIEVDKDVTPVGEKKLDLEEDLKLRLKISAQACDGDYTLKIDVVAGTAERSALIPITISGVKTCSVVTEDTLRTQKVTLGNQTAAAGSALDADFMAVYSSQQFSAPSVQATIDLWFGIVSGGTAKMMAPSVATGFAPVSNNWTTKNSTKILKVSAAFDQIKTQSQINALWTETGSVSSVQIAANDVFVIKTVEGNYRLLRIVSASASESGNAVVIGRIK
ncbi:MAG: hypothetical protein JW915_23435 [Chitinispirillaceae bacterium]|nr:hypothetical protein [Chitinispirillaceae bacterium]